MAVVSSFVFVFLPREPPHALEYVINEIMELYGAKGFNRNTLNK